MKFYRNQDIEDLAEERLPQLAQLLKQPLTSPITPPIPIDILAEKVLGLEFLWEEIDELPGERVLGALHPRKRLIVINETHRALFDAKAGLERSTKGHEMGHWDLFIAQGVLEHPALFASDNDGPLTRRSSPIGEVTTINPTTTL